MIRRQIKLPAILSKFRIMFYEFLTVGLLCTYFYLDIFPAKAFGAFSSRIIPRKA